MSFSEGSCTSPRAGPCRVQPTSEQKVVAVLCTRDRESRKCLEAYCTDEEASPRTFVSTATERKARLGVAFGYAQNSVKSCAKTGLVSESYGRFRPETDVAE